MKKSFFGLMAFAMFLPLLSYSQTNKTDAILKEYETAMEYRTLGRWEEAYPIFRKLADMGEPMSQVELAIGYLIGQDLPKDENQASQLIFKSAETGYPEALYWKGNFFFYGQAGVQKDIKQGIFLFEKAALAGSYDAQFELCIFPMVSHSKGFEVVAEDVEKAYFWCLVAENSSDPTANGVPEEYARLLENGFFEGTLTSIRIQEIQAMANVFQPIKWKYPTDLFDK